MHYRDGSAHVANFVRNRVHQNSRSHQQLMQAQFLPAAQLFGCIHHHGRQPGSGACGVRRKPNVSEKYFPIPPPPPALHHGAKRLAIMTQRGNINQCRKIIANRLARQGARRNREQAMRGIVGQQHGTVGVRW